jgi:hypothetical protein
MTGVAATGVATCEEVFGGFFATAFFLGSFLGSGWTRTAVLSVFALRATGCADFFAGFFAVLLAARFLVTLFLDTLFLEAFCLETLFLDTPFAVAVFFFAA